MDGAIEVRSADRLRELLGHPGERARNKVRQFLDHDDIEWLRASTLCFLATSGSDGRCDSSPKGDPAGRLVHVIDRTHIALAERPGNRRVDGYLNILANPHVGLLFLVPGRSDVLRINGVATLLEDATWFGSLALDNSRPRIAVLVTIEEVFGHCAKALVRSQAWHPETWRGHSLRDVSATARHRRSQGLPELQTSSYSARALEQAQVASYDSPLY